MFKPTINQKSQQIKRDTKIEDHLGEDAKRRAEQKKEQEKTKIKNENSMYSPSRATKNSQSLLYQKLVKDLEEIQHNFKASQDEAEQEENNDSGAIDVSKALEYLRALGFLDVNDTRSTELSTEAI